MGNTIQVVTWTLERKCALRNGSDWANPQVANQQLAYIASYSRAVATRKILKGAWITGSMSSSGIELIFPRGQVITKAFEQFGGLPAIQDQCLACEANAALDSNGLAGCTGMLYPLESSAIQDILEQQNLVDDYKTAFMQTDPLWFGLWVESPLSRPQMEILRTVFSELVMRRDSQAHRYEAFASALSIGLNTPLSLHVEVAPPGHADMGVMLTFSHCPRCKVWSEGEVGKMTTCHVCHLEYVVPETLMEEDKYDEPYELEHVLDNNAYEQFVRDYWLSQGHSSNEIDAALETRRDQQRKRKRN